MPVDKDSAVGMVGCNSFAAEAEQEAVEAEQEVAAEAEQEVVVEVEQEAVVEVEQEVVEVEQAAEAVVLQPEFHC